MSKVTWHPSWPDVRVDGKRIVARLDPHHENHAVELRLSVRSTTIHLSPESCRELAEKLLHLARVIEKLEANGGQWQKRGDA